MTKPVTDGADHRLIGTVAVMQQIKSFAGMQCQFRKQRNKGLLCQLVFQQEIIGNQNTLLMHRRINRQ